MDDLNSSTSLADDSFSWLGASDIEDERILLEELGYGENWEPLYRDQPYEEAFSGAHRAKKLELPPMLPSRFVTFAFRMPKRGGGYENFSLAGRPYLPRIYDSSGTNILLLCARQVEKSTNQGNKIITYSCLIPAHRSLFVSPSATQTKTFSTDRIKEPLETSEILRQFASRSLSQNVFEKQFANRSIIRLRYAYLTADRARGIPSDKLFMDEYQDLLRENIPIIEECTSHAHPELKSHQYSGTPKTLSNPIEELHSRWGTQYEWCVPCESCNHWNILGVKNIGLKGLICERCGKPIRPDHPRAQWGAQGSPTAPWESYRIPQLIVPWIPWKELLFKYRSYPQAQFHNEVLGLSFDSGVRPLNLQQVQACCNEDVLMRDAVHYRAKASANPIWFGIDWGPGTQVSYTVLVACTYVEGKFRVILAKRFDHQDVDLEQQMRKIMQLILWLNPQYVGTDWGGGLYPNDRLVKRFGADRIRKFQYVGRIRRKVMWVPKLGHFVLNRTAVMGDIFNAIKARKLELPCWEEWREPFAQDMTSIYGEMNERLHVVQYDRDASRPDDTFHAILYAWLASMLTFPRPDILKDQPNHEPGYQQFDQGSGLGGIRL